MKKQMFTIILLILTSVTLSAQIKSPNKKTVPQKPVVSPEMSVKTKAEKWFKDFYVEKFFKDPYSYRLLKITTDSVSTKQSLIDSIYYIASEIEKCNIAEKDRTKENRDEWQKSYDEVIADLKKEEANLEKETDKGQIAFRNKLIAINKEYALKYLSVLKDFNIYFLNFGERTRLEKRLNSLSPKQENEFAFFKVKLDCYSKNSLGNEVLGRFQFPFTEKGSLPTSDVSGGVIQLNKD